MERPESDDPRDSGMRIEVSIGVGYQRRRSQVADKFETRMSTLGLLLIGGAVVLFLIFIIVPRILEGLR